MPVDPVALRRAFGREMRARRLARGVSQEALALEAGVSMRHVSELERGLQTPSLVTVVALELALRCQPGELVNRAAQQKEH
jgi:transcriptional regulator with XRE-family HTH domain